jgi:hypothetical protein
VFFKKKLLLKELLKYISELYFSSDFVVTAIFLGSAFCIFLKVTVKTPCESSATGSSSVITP